MHKKQNNAITAIHQYQEIKGKLISNMLLCTELHTLEFQAKQPTINNHTPLEAFIF